MKRFIVQNHCFPVSIRQKIYYRKIAWQLRRHPKKYKDQLFSAEAVEWTLEYASATEAIIMGLRRKMRFYQ